LKVGALKTAEKQKYWVCLYKIPMGLLHSWIEKVHFQKGSPIGSTRSIQFLLIMCRLFLKDAEKFGGFFWGGGPFWGKIFGSAHTHTFARTSRNNSIFVSPAHLFEIRRFWAILEKMGRYRLSNQTK
jgi:hypothetical protein